VAKQNRQGYRQLTAELAKILEWFESDKPDLDQAVAKYQAAQKLLAEIERYLQAAENQVRKVSKRQK